jgi:hypothetical protein
LARSICISLPPMSLAAPEYACPECGKVFQDERRVTLHLNHPRSACHSWMHEQVAMPGDQMPAHSTAGHMDEDPVDANDLPADDPYIVSFISITIFYKYLIFYQDNDNFSAITDPPFSPSPSPAAQNHFVASESIPIIDVHPAAGQIYGAGSNTLQRLDSDEHAPARSQNPYYPFASKQEWKMGRWLLLSGASQSTIDEYFRLEHVCITFTYPSPVSRITGHCFDFRPHNSHCHFKLQSSFALAMKYSPLGLNGTAVS